MLQKTNFSSKRERLWDALMHFHSNRKYPIQSKIHYYGLICLTEKSFSLICYEWNKYSNLIKEKKWILRYLPELSFLLNLFEEHSISAEQKLCSLKCLICSCTHENLSTFDLSIRTHWRFLQRSEIG